MIKYFPCKLFLATALATPLIGSTPPARADDVVTLSAAAVRPALVELPALFEKTTGHRLKLSFGNATAIENKVRAGEPADVVILPMPQLHSLATQMGLGMVARTPFGLVRLGIAAKADAGKPAVTTVDEFKEALLGASSFGMPDPADGSTSSTYLVKMMEELGISAQMTPKTKLFADGTKALEAVAKGEIALTIAPVTSICAVLGVVLVAPLPERLQLKTAYFAAITGDAIDSEAAHRLMTLLFSDEVAEILMKKCIDVP